MVFSAGYEADHWCAKGHVIFVHKGELIVEYEEGRILKVPEGDTVVLADDLAPHKAKAGVETCVFVVG